MIIIEVIHTDVTDLHGLLLSVVLPSTVLSTTYTVDLYIGKHVEKKQYEKLVM